MTPTSLKGRVLMEAGQHPGPFSFADIANRLGDGYGSGGPNERRLRRTLDALRRTGAVVTVQHGVMQASGGSAGPGVDMIGAVEQFMRDNGGVARAEEIRVALDLDDAGRRTLHRVLEAGRYETLPTMHDGRRWWSLPDAERLALASPGWRVEIDMALERLRAGRPWRSGIGDINDRRRAIGWAVQDARDAVDLDVASVLRTVGRMFAADLERGSASILVGGGSMRLGEWWRGQRDCLGMEAALTKAWTDLEEGEDVGSAWPGAALSSASWSTLAALVGADPAALSRGLPS